MSAQIPNHREEVRTIALINKTEETGHDLLAELQEAVASVAGRIEDREYVVEERLRTLEQEQAALKQARSTVAAVNTAATAPVEE